MTSKQKKAVALQYDQKQAPKVVASGAGDLAYEIEQAAIEAGILVHEDKQLAEVLSKLEIGEAIPPALYLVIAELIAYAYMLEGKFPEQWQNIHQKIDFKA
ncbi:MULTISPECIES: EscU/YscU/HrcU family type III secretion system export apparatus switch protein [Ferrimonas]|uniref:Flagellar biosynthetic protein FlhB n=1 Tax=Ferrimonas sediminum TaxID=718193 RepID=A0A1G8YYE1_9GAMM|nr:MULTISPECIES: EscU/YscU/HrcU family type III secretion system export apparatus switch protein [Ferrimonas]USD38654.1 EscU/YscU/HrcU family type III secretion system export apparatus switch protein [Ferrimonas sp. SCSIO 43195]SDK07791.1 flagellar biosynthesis protein [Ferrimonas sediminum]